MALIIFVLIGVFAAFSFYEEPLNEGYEEFFAANVIADDQNGYIEMMGIVAPVGQDPKAFGQEYVSKLRNETKTLNYENLETAFDNTSIDVEFIETDSLKEKSSSLECWYADQDYQAGEEACLNEEELVLLVNENEGLLQRLRALNKYEQFDFPQGIGISSTPSGQLVIALHQLELSRITLLLKKGDFENAVNSWLLLTELNQKKVSGFDTLVGQAVRLINFGMVYKYTPVLVSHLPSEAMVKYQGNIKSALNYDVMGPDGWNVQKTMQAEHYALIDNLHTWIITNSPDMNVGRQFSGGFLDQIGGLNFHYKDNMMRNNHYEFASDLVELSKMDASEIGEASDNLSRQYNDKYSFDSFWKIISPNLVGDLLMGGMVKGSELVVQGHRTKAFMNGYKIYLEAKMNQIPTSNMKDFVKNQSDKAYPEIDYLWDEEEQAIYFNFPSPNSLRYSIPYR